MKPKEPELSDTSAAATTGERLEAIVNKTVQRIHGSYESRFEDDVRDIIVDAIEEAIAVLLALVDDLESIPEPDVDTKVTALRAQLKEQREALENLNSVVSDFLRDFRGGYFKQSSYLLNVHADALVNVSNHAIKTLAPSADQKQSI